MSRSQSLVGVQRHELNEADFEVLLPAHFHQFQNFIFREILHGHRVDFNGFKPDSPGLRNAVQYLLQAIAPVDVREFFFIQSIETDIDAFQTRFLENRRLIFQEKGVGGQRDILDALHPVQHLNESGQIFSEEWFTAGQADAVDSHFGHHAGHLGDFLKRQQFAPVHELHVVRRHAIGTAEITTVGD